MNSYQVLLSYLKILNQNLNMLHRDMIGTNFFGNHEKLQEYYEKIQDYTDELCEVGRTFGIKEPSIKEAILKFENVYEVIETKERNGKESFTLVREWFKDLIELIEKVKPETKNFISNRLEELQYYLNTEANYKLIHLLEEVGK